MQSVAVAVLRPLLITIVGDEPTFPVFPAFPNRVSRRFVVI